MPEHRRISLTFGVLFIITFITSIPALGLFQPVLDDPAGYVAGDGEDNQIYLGVLLELLLIVANIGTAVVVFPILRRQNEILSLGYVTARIVECVFIAAGVLFVLGIVSLRQDDPDNASLAVSLAARLASTALSRGSRHRLRSSQPSHELRGRFSLESAGSERSSSVLRARLRWPEMGRCRNRHRPGHTSSTHAVPGASR